MFTSKDEVVEFIEDNDIKFIRLAFSDISGVQRNIAIQPSMLPHAIEKGIAFNANNIEGFSKVCASKLYLFPDLTTFALLPWRPSHGRVARFFCNIKRPDGTNFELDTRQLLKNTEKRLNQEGYCCEIALESEFYLFEADENGKSTLKPVDNGDYLCVAPDDRCENIRREICLTIEQMGIIPQSSHHEAGPGQNEVDFKADSPLCSADNTVTFRSVVNTVADKNGLCASFMPKPLIDNVGNGFNIIIKLKNKNAASINECEVESFIAGVLEHIGDITVITNPTEQSYERIAAYPLLKYISWTSLNALQLVRVSKDENKNICFALSSPDNISNPYLAFTAIINAGIDGIKNKMLLPHEVRFDENNKNDDMKEMKTLPLSFREAMDRAKNSAFLLECMPREILNAIDDRQKNLKV